MSHEEMQDLLEGYVEETLDRHTRRLVDEHLGGCEECRSILDGVAPVELGEAPLGSWGAREMRRAVRRGLFRVAFDAILVVLAIWLAAWGLSLAILHPLLIDRDDRPGAALRATADLAVMYNPGASVAEYEHRSDFLGMSAEVKLVTAVGTDLVDLGAVESHLGLFAFGSLQTGRLFPDLSDTDLALGGTEHLLTIPEGTVSTVQLQYEDPIDLEDATRLVETPHDVRVTWAGFAVDDPESTGSLALGGIVGYSACDSRPIEGEVSSGSSGGGSRSPFSEASSVARAADLVRGAVGNLLAHPELLDGMGASVTEAEQALARLERPMVRSLTVTGPTDQVIEFVDDAVPDSIAVVDIEFTNWFQPLCGR